MNQGLFYVSFLKFYMFGNFSFMVRKTLGEEGGSGWGGGLSKKVVQGSK